MSNYGRWTGNNSTYETGYGNGAGNDYSSNYNSTSSGYGGGASYGGDTSAYGGLSTSFDSGTTSYNTSGTGTSNFETSSGYGTGSSNYNTGDSNYGGSSYVSGGSYSTGGSSSYGGGGSSTRMSSSSGSNYDNFLSNQQNQVTDMSRKLRKMEMMQEIAKLEQEDDMEELMLKKKLESLRQQKRMKHMTSAPNMNSYGSNNNFGGMMSSPPMSRNLGGYGNRGSFGNQRNNPMGRNFPRGDRGRTGNRGGGAVRGDRRSGMGNRNDRRNSSGPGKSENLGKKPGRFADNKNKNAGNERGQDRKRKPENTKNSNDRNTKRPRKEGRAPVSEKEREEKLNKFIEGLKTASDKNDDVSTFYSTLRSTSVHADIKYFQKTGALFFDRLFLARGRKNPFKQMAFKEAIVKLKTLSLEKIKADANEISTNSAVLIERDNNNKQNIHESDEVYRSPLEFAELPFVERLGLFIEAMKTYGLLNVRIFCARYLINCIQIYEFHENEDLPHEHHIYLNEVYITSGRGAFKKESDIETMNKMMEILEDKSVEEIMKNDNRFSKDYPEYPLYVKDVGIGNEIMETNHLDLKFGQNITDFEALKSKNPDDIIMIEEAAWRSSRFKVLQESATNCQMVLKCTWTTEHPGGSIDDDGNDTSDATKEEQEYKELLKKTRKIAIDKKVMMIHCKIELQDKLIGRSVDVAKGIALKNAATKAYTTLQETQSVICHDYGGKKLDSKQYQWDELVVKAKELRKELPDAPNFDHVKISPSRDEESMQSCLGEEHGDGAEEDGADVKEENVEEVIKKEKTEENGDTTEKEKSEAKKKEEEELAPWIKEVVRREIEELSNTDILVESVLFLHKAPMYVRDVVNHYTLEYNVSLKTDWKGKKIGRLSIRKKLPNIFTLLDKLKAIKEKKSGTFILEQSRTKDGSIEKHNERTVRRWQQHKNPRNRRFRRR